METDSPVKTEIVRVVSLSTAEISEITRSIDRCIGRHGITETVDLIQRVKPLPDNPIFKRPGNEGHFVALVVFVVVTREKFDHLGHVSFVVF